MPRRSQYPLSGQPLSGNAPSGVVVAPALDISPIVRGATAAAGAAVAVNDMLNDQADALAVVKAEGAFQERVVGGIEGLDASAPDYLQQVDALFEGAKDEAMDANRVSSPVKRARLEASFARAKMEARSQAVRHREQYLDAMVVDEVAKAANTMTSGISKDPENAALYQQQYLATAKTLIDGLPAHKRAKLISGASREAVLALADGYAQSGKFEEARAVLDGQEASTYLDRGDKAAALARVDRHETRAEREALAKRREFANVVRLGVARGEISEAQYNKILASGAFEGVEGAAVSIEGVFDRRQRAAERQADRAERLADKKAREELEARLTGGFTPEVRAQKQDEALAVVKGDPVEFMRLYGPAVPVIGLPPVVERAIKLGGVSRDPKALALAAKAQQQVDANAPGLNIGSTPRVTAVLSLADATGVPVDDAAAAFLATEPKNTAEMKARSDMVDMAVKEAGGTAKLAGKLLDDELAADYRVSSMAVSTYREMVGLLGDHEKAAAATKKRLASMGVGTTSVGGKIGQAAGANSTKENGGMATISAPEIRWAGLSPFFASFDESDRAALVRDWIGEALTAKGAQPGVTFRLVEPRDHAAREARGLPPAYNVVAERGGIPVMVTEKTASGREVPWLVTYPGDDALLGTTLGKRLLEVSRSRREGSEAIPDIGKALRSLNNPSAQDIFDLIEGGNAGN